MPQLSILIQKSPLAGLQYHEGETVWSKLRENDPLQLVREQDNRFDGRTVAVYWQDTSSVTSQRMRTLLLHSCWTGARRWMRILSGYRRAGIRGKEYS